MAAFVWLDSGNNLDHSIKGPWSHNPGQTRLHPINMYSPMNALNPTILESAKLRLQEHLDWSKQPQTAALLPLRYGSKLRPEKLDRGVMYVLYEIFSMSAYSESRFLVQVDSTLRKTLGHVNEDRFDGFTDLTFIRRLLYRHIQQTQTAIIALKNFQSLDSPDHRGSKENKASKAEVKAGTTTMWILQDFNHNLEYAKALDEQCKEGIAVLMSSASIAESRKAMAQQERIGKLTLLAFLFVPLSFTTSFFGMNFKELSAQVMSIWAWFVMAIPVVAITQIAYFCTVKQLTAPFRRLRDWMLWRNHKKIKSRA
jgi:CorA-like Mg2+ transporter protein